MHVFFISEIGLKKEGLVESKRVAVILPCLKFNWAVEDWLCYLLSAKEFEPICWNQLENKVKKDIVYQCFHLLLIVIAYIPC